VNRVTFLPTKLHRSIACYILAIAILGNALNSVLVYLDIRAAFLTSTFSLASIFAYFTLIKKNRFVVDVKIFSLIIFLSILYYFVHSGLMVVAYFALFIALSIYSIFILEIYDKFKTLLIISFSLAFLSYLLFLGGFLSPTVFFVEERAAFLHGMTISHFSSFSLEQPGSWRFSGFSDEPGAATAIILFVLIHENFKIIGNRILLFYGALTFSTGFFLISFIYFLYYKILVLKKENIANLLLFSILITAFLGLSPEPLRDYLGFKAFYILFEDKDFALREDSTVLYLLSLNQILVFIYFISILMFPKKFWLFLLALSFYRFNFVLNFVPIIALILSADRLKRHAPSWTGAWRVKIDGMSSSGRGRDAALSNLSSTDSTKSTSSRPAHK